MRPWLGGLVLLVVSATSAHADDKELARKEYAEGARLYALRDYAKALESFQAAYMHYEAPAFLYNVAQCYRQLGKLDEAIGMYTNYLQLNPSLSQQEREETEQIIRDMQKHLDEQKRMPTQPPLGTRSPDETAHVAAPAQPPPMMARSGKTLKLAGLAVGLVGVAAAVVGVAFGVLAQQAGSDLTQLGKNHMPFDPAKQSAGDLDQTLEYTFLGIGAAAVVTGVVVAALGFRAAKRERVTLAPVLSPGRASLQMQLHF